MALVTFQVIDGVDKGRRFLNIETPVTIGREEGNVVRLNDERVSRFHAKVQEDQGQVVLTDLDSTNGTRVNGEPIQLRLLRPGDRLNIGRSTLLFGTLGEIAEGLPPQPKNGPQITLPLSNPSKTGAPEPAIGTDLSSEVSESFADLNADVDVLERVPPPLPTQLSPAQAAQLSETLDFLHRALADATEPVTISPGAKEALLPIASWQRIQAVLTFLARYSRQVAEPDEPSG